MVLIEGKIIFFKRSFFLNFSNCTKLTIYGLRRPQFSIKKKKNKCVHAYIQPVFSCIHLTCIFLEVESESARYSKQMRVNSALGQVGLS